MAEGALVDCTKDGEKTGGRREGDGEKKKKEGDQTNLPSFPCSSFLLVLSSVLQFLQSHSLSLFSVFLHHSLALSPRLYPPPICPSLSTSPSIFFLNHLFQNLFCNPTLPLFLYFTRSPLRFVSSSPHHPFISCFLPPFFANPLLSHYLSPSIVVVVDYVIRAEDMSFLSTRFNAQHDYTKPLSTVSFSL